MTFNDWFDINIEPAIQLPSSFNVIRGSRLVFATTLSAGAIG
jgi:hypothetical protein